MNMNMFLLKQLEISKDDIGSGLIWVDIVIYFYMFIKLESSQIGNIQTSINYR